MTSEDAKKFETLQDLFAHEGWALLVEEMNAKIEAIKEGFTRPGLTVDYLAFGQGRINVYREMDSLPRVIEHALNEYKEDAQAARDVQASTV